MMDSHSPRHAEIAVSLETLSGEELKMARDICSAGTDSPVLSCVFSVRNRLQGRLVTSG